MNIPNDTAAYMIKNELFNLRSKLMCLPPNEHFQKAVEAIEVCASSVAKGIPALQQAEAKAA